MDLPPHWPTNAEPVEIAPGLWTPRVARIRSADWKEGPLVGLDIRIHAHLDDGMRYMIDHFEINTDGTTTINGALLRKVPVNAIFTATAEEFASVKLDRRGWTQYSYISKRSTQARDDLMDADDLVNVARIYAHQLTISGKPAQEVAHLLDIPTSTADYWIRRAKDKGLIYAEA